MITPITFQTITHSEPTLLQNETSVFTHHVKQYNKLSDLTFISGGQNFPRGGYTANDNLFHLLEWNQLKNLQNDKTTFFVFNAEMEGDHPEIFFKLLYHNCQKYKVPSKKIIFVTSNLNGEQAMDTFNKRYNIGESIHLFSYMAWKHFIFSFFYNKHFKQDISSKTVLSYCTSKLNNQYTDQYLLSLSRRPRPHRNFLHYLLLNDNLITQQSLISQDKLTSHKISLLVNNEKIEREKAERWADTLPAIADTTDFETNHANKLNTDLQSSTLFQVIGESWADTQQAGLFYSEKTFRPMISMQPFLIFGQPRCNARLKEFGFKLFTDMFDYSFDEEPNVQKRAEMLHIEIRRIFNLLNTMSREQQIQWRFQNKDILEHNYNMLVVQDYEKQQIYDFFDALHSV